ncbi:hypothetical protein BD779DRAFT_1733045 [Infundibulicybe gibba]|nr:hypothetical protein BD779DRAFT_1733045 [Infundibulicybe gibba]
MHPFGGTPVCPRCLKLVYAAEQAMGPGRKLYHKPCLACTICNKRLDSLTLLEHDQQVVFSKSCHVKNFGTRDLRQANLPYKEASSTPSSPTSPTAFPPSPKKSANSPFPPTRGLFAGNRNDITPPTPLPRSNRPPASTPTAQESSASEESEEEGDEEARDTVESMLNSNPALEPTSPISRGTAPRPRHHVSNSLGSIPRINQYPFTNVTLERSSANTQDPIRPLVQTSTGTMGTRYGSALGGSISVNVTGSGSPRRWGAETPQCPKCSKNVYFAEQVKAVGKTFHKACLRCTECNTSLDSNRLRDHDGQLLCMRCYGKLHGPQGSGYALLGKAGG